eukprot:10046.XXX_496930_497094_1 [CDS] Oithona nana genome sequencing.
MRLATLRQNGFHSMEKNVAINANDKTLLSQFFAPCLRCCKESEQMKKKCSILDM